MKRYAGAHVGLLVGLSVIIVLALFPFTGAESWIVNIGIFTLMYAVLGSAWNLIGGYTGYVSLGSVAFFGLGAYALALTFQHIGIGNGFLPFALVPIIGIAVGDHQLADRLDRLQELGACRLSSSRSRWSSSCNTWR